MNFCITGTTLKYMTNKAVEKTVEISFDNAGVMSYKGFSTKNQYDLICRTSLFDEIFGTFPNHYVALTDQAFKLPPEKQPWFFGNISNDEAEAKLMGTAFRFYQINQIYCILEYFLIKFHRGRQPPYIFDTISGLPNMATMECAQARRAPINLAHGLFRRADHVAQEIRTWTLQRRCRATFARVEILQINLRGSFARCHELRGRAQYVASIFGKKIQTNFVFPFLDIDLRSHEFQYPSPLGEFLRNYKKHGIHLVHWLLDNGVSLDPR